MATRTPAQRYLLQGFIVSVCLCALVGIYCLLVGAWSTFHARVLGTAGAVAAASILGLISALPWERRIWPPVGPLGAAVVTAALGLGLVGIWMPELPGEGLLKGIGIASVFAIGLPHVGLLALARLRPGHGWVRTATVATIAALAGQLTATILAEPKDDAWYRAMGILGIATACGSIVVPILHRVSSIPREAAETRGEIVALVCPRCGGRHEAPLGRSRCPGCAIRFRIEID